MDGITYKFRTIKNRIGGMEMQKGYVIIASNGAEIIDTRPEAEAFISAMDIEEQIYNARQRRKETKRQRKMSRNPFYILACAVGIL